MFDADLLRTFVAVADARGFSKAGRQLGLRQSTVSEQIRRLETLAARRLFVRDTHTVTLTADGIAMLSFARAILDANERAKRYFAGSKVRERIRFGAPENFVRTKLPNILTTFQTLYPTIDLELRVGLSGALFDELDEGDLDIVLGKRRIGEDRGQLVQREEMVWIGRKDTRLAPDVPVPLVMYPPPSMSRALAIETLDEAGIPWRIVCTCNELMGLQAATLGGFGVMVQPRSTIPPGLCELPQPHHLPAIGQVEFVVASGSRGHGGAAGKLADLILARSSLSSCA